MTPDELDAAYAALSQTLARVSYDEAELFLARLALLLIVACGDGQAAVSAIERAGGALPAA